MRTKTEDYRALAPASAMREASIEIGGRTDGVALELRATSVHGRGSGGEGRGRGEHENKTPRATLVAPQVHLTIGWFDRIVAWLCMVSSSVGTAMAVPTAWARRVLLRAHRLQCCS